LANPKPISRFAFYPTQKAIWILGLGLPLALILSVIFPQLWAIGAAWAAAIIGLVLLDTFLATPVKMMEPALLQRLWSRWQGPLGLIWMQRQDPLDHHLAIIPNIQLVTETAMQFFSRDAHNIIFALDSGYLMCEDMVDENATRLTKLDRSITAILIMGYVSLKMGDRVGLFSFDKAPSLYTAPVSGTQQFGGFQNKASQIQYSNEETNYTYGLSFLAQKLRRRSLIVVFTDFVDMTQSELMLETVARLLKRHLIIFVAFRNQPLSDLTTKTVETPSDISQAVIAQNILSERSLVLTRLRRMGVDVLDADPNSLNTDIVNRYLALKAKGAL